MDDKILEEYLKKVMLEKGGGPSIYSPEIGEASLELREQSADAARGANLTKDLLAAANQMGTLGGVTAKVPGGATFDAAVSKDKQIQDYLSKQYEGQQEFAQKMALQKPEKKTYDTLETSEGIVSVNKNDPSDIIRTGLKKPAKEEKPETPQSVAGYVIKGTDKPVFRSSKGYVDELGNKVAEIELKPEKTPQQQQKSEKELAYRYNILKQNAEDLKSLIKKHGTMEVMGAEGAMMDDKLYQIAVDYAKLVDPDSVAREGEVAAAKKYMLPVRESLVPFGPAGSAYTNKTAVELVDNYIKGLDKRLEARRVANEGSVYQAGTKSSGDSGSAIASPAKTRKVEQDGYIFEIDENGKTISSRKK